MWMKTLYAKIVDFATLPDPATIHLDVTYEDGAGWRLAASGQHGSLSIALPGKPSARTLAMACQIVGKSNMEARHG